MTRLDRHVAGVQNRLMLERMLQALAWSFLVLAGVFALEVIITRLFALHLHRSGLWLFGGFVLASLAGLIWGMRRRPSPAEAAIYIDDKLSLHEKFSTALYARKMQDPFAAATVRDAEHTADNVSLHKRFPLAWPRAAWLTFAAAVVALLLAWLLPEFDLVGHKAQQLKRLELSHAQAVKTEHNLRQALVQLDAAPKAIADNESVKMAKQELADLLKQPNIDPVVAQKKAESALAQMESVKQQINEQQTFAQNRIDSKALSDLMPAPSEKGPIADAQRAMAQGDMSKAVEDVKKVVDNFDKMDEKEKEKAAEQMKNLAQQLATQAQDPKVQQQIQKQLQQMGATQQQAQQMAQQMQLAANGDQQAQQQLQRQMQQLAQQQNTQQGGSTQQQQQRAQQVQQALSQMQQQANGQAQSQQLSQAASQLAKAMGQGIKVGTSQGAGQQQGQQQGQQPGQQASAGQQGTQQGQQSGQSGQQQGQNGQQPGQNGQQPGQGTSAQQQAQQMAAASQAMQQQLKQMQAMAKDGQAVAAGQQGQQGQSEGQGSGGDNPGQEASAGEQPGQGGQGQGGQGDRPDGQQGGQNGQQGNAGELTRADQGNNPGQQGGAGGPNGHGGAHPGERATPFGIKQELSQSQTNESGKILASSFVKVPSDKGKSNIGLSKAILKEEQEATDEVEQDRIPKSAQNAVKDYFQTLKEDAK